MIATEQECQFQNNNIAKTFKNNLRKKEFAGYLILYRTVIDCQKQLTVELTFCFLKIILQTNPLAGL